MAIDHRGQANLNISGSEMSEINLQSTRRVFYNTWPSSVALQKEVPELKSILKMLNLIRPAYLLISWENTYYNMNIKISITGFEPIYYYVGSLKICHSIRAIKLIINYIMNNLILLFVENLTITKNQLKQENINLIKFALPLDYSQFLFLNTIHNHS